MNTFLPYRSFERSARVLDRQRLGKQRVEVLQLLRTLAGERRGWRNHPAARMWVGHERSLIEYGLAVCAEWTRRGYRDSCAAKIAAYWDVFPASGLPPWLGERRTHRAYQSNLVRKDPSYYRPYFPNVPDDVPYTWGIERPPRTGVVRGGRGKLR